ncbi:MAG: hypothetical protein KDC35_01330 [Acidobacteria bacterium]|nr:hypothetical protein [Acidobacteriota bacterium]
MEYQVDFRRGHKIRIGTNQQELAVFGKAGFFIYNLKGQGEWSDYHMKLPAPWTQFRYRLFHGETELANAKKRRRMHVFDPERPFSRHSLIEFELELEQRTYLLTPQDRHYLLFLLMDQDREVARFTTRPFDQQDAWQAALTTPDHWTPATAGFIAWLASEARNANRS